MKSLSIRRAETAFNKSLNYGCRGGRGSRRQLWFGIGLRCGDRIRWRIRAGIRPSKRRYGWVKTRNRAGWTRAMRLEEGAVNETHESMDAKSGDASCRAHYLVTLTPTSRSPAGLPASVCLRAAKGPRLSEPPCNPAIGEPQVQSTGQRQRRESTP